MHRAVNDYEDKKQRRSNQSQNQLQQQHYSDYGSQMGHMQGNYHHGNHNANNVSQEMQPQDFRRNSRGFETPINLSPPPYHQAGGQGGSAHEYYSGKKL
jgi:hypothetical protein